MAKMLRPSALYISLLWLVGKPAECGQYAAFLTDLGTQLIVLDSTTGAFEYSPCNSGSTPAWPTDSRLELPIQVAPKNGSNIAAVGYVENDVVYADVFWQNTGFDLEHERFKCDMTAGTYSLVSHESPDGSLSDDDDMPDVSIVTGLAAVHLDGSSGTRLFFHDDSAYLHQLEYTTEWSYIGIVSPDNHLQGPAVGVASVNGTAEMWTVEARSDANLELAGTFLGNPWSLTTVPRSLTNTDTTSTSTQNFTVNSTEAIFVGLEAWPTQVANLGIALDQDDSKYLFYIGSDKALYYVTSEATKNLGAWSVYLSLDTKYWPLADTAAADFAIASDSRSYEIRLYYMSEGSMVQVLRTGQDTWAKAAALPTKAAAVKTATSTSAASATPTASEAAAVSAGSSSSSNGATSATSSKGLSAGAKAGIGIGVGVAGMLVLGLGFGVFCARRHTKREDEAASSGRGTAAGRHSRRKGGGGHQQLMPWMSSSGSGNETSYGTTGTAVAVDAGSSVDTQCEREGKQQQQLVDDKEESLVGLGYQQKRQSTIYTGNPSPRPVVTPGAAQQQPNVTYIPAYELSTSPSEPKYEMMGSYVAKLQSPTELYSPDQATLVAQQQQQQHGLHSLVSPTTDEAAPFSAVRQEGPFSPVSELDSSSVGALSPQPISRFNTNNGEKRRSRDQAWVTMASFEKSGKFYGPNE